MRSSSPEEEREAMCDELTVTPIPHPPVPLRGRRETNGSEVEPRETGVKLSPGRSEGRGKGVLRFSFLSHYPTLISLVIN